MQDLAAKPFNEQPAPKPLASFPFSNPNVGIRKPFVVPQPHSSPGAETASVPRSPALPKDLGDESKRCSSLPPPAGLPRRPSRRTQETMNVNQMPSLSGDASASDASSSIMPTSDKDPFDSEKRFSYGMRPDSNAPWLTPHTDHPLSQQEQMEILERVRADLVGVDPNTLTGPFKQLAREARAYGSAQQFADYALKQPLRKSSSQQMTVSPQEAFDDYQEVMDHQHDEITPAQPLFPPLPGLSMYDPATLDDATTSLAQIADDPEDMFADSNGKPQSPNLGFSFPKNAVGWTNPSNESSQWNVHRTSPYKQYNMPTRQNSTRSIESAFNFSPSVSGEEESNPATPDINHPQFLFQQPRNIAIDPSLEPRSNLPFYPLDNSYFTSRGGYEHRGGPAESVSSIDSYTPRDIPSAGSSNSFSDTTLSETPSLTGGVNKSNFRVNDPGSSLQLGPPPRLSTAQNTQSTKSNRAAPSTSRNKGQMNPIVDIPIPMGPSDIMVHPIDPSITEAQSQSPMPPPASTSRNLGSSKSHSKRKVSPPNQPTYAADSSTTIPIAGPSREPGDVLVNPKQEETMGFEEDFPDGDDSEDGDDYVPTRHDFDAEADYVPPGGARSTASTPKRRRAASATPGALKQEDDDDAEVEIPKKKRKTANKSQTPRAPRANKGGSTAPPGNIKCDHEDENGKKCGTLFRRPYDVSLTLVYTH